MRRKKLNSVEPNQQTRRLSPMTWRMPAFLVGLLVAASALGACGGDSETASGIPRNDAPFDIAEILVSGPTVTNLSSSSATILAETNADVVCAVTYGTTTEYGRIATDLDMAGGGHRNHQPMLLGLKPDTLYHYKFGGTASDGRVFSSRDYIFRTPVAEVAAEQRGENLALLGKGAGVFEVSSNFAGASNDGAFGANLAIDGDPRTQWSPDGDGDDAWIEIALPSDSLVSAVGFWTRTMGSSAEITSFRVVSDQGEVRGPFSLPDAFSVHYFDTDLTAQRLRFEVLTSSGGNTGAVEIQVYGEPAITP